MSVYGIGAAKAAQYSRGFLEVGHARQPFARRSMAEQISVRDASCVNVAARYRASRIDARDESALA